MYMGAGATPLIQAANAWATLAAELTSMSAAFSQVVNGLNTTWHGPSALAMTAASVPHITWLMTTAGLASETAARAMAAVAAFEAAFISTVPPPLVAANRARLADLVATNFLGINTPAIMATEAQYMQMWAQDVAAMIQYQVASAEATALAPFRPLAESLGGIFAPGSNQATTGLAGMLNLFSGASQSAFGSALNSAAVNSLFSSGFYFGIPAATLQSLGSLLTFGTLGQGQRQIEIAEENIPSVGEPSVVPGNAGAVAEASMGSARQVGALSTPRSWGPPADPTYVTAESGTAGEAPFGMLPPMIASGKGPVERARYGVPLKGVVPRHPSGG
jgi:PPE-repeat protein